PPTYQRRAPLRLPLVPRNGCGRPGRAPERFLPLDITSLLLHVIFDARFLLRQRSEERRVGKECRSRCLLYLLKKKQFSKNIIFCVNDNNSIRLITHLYYHLYWMYS